MRWADTVELRIYLLLQFPALGYVLEVEVGRCQAFIIDRVFRGRPALGGSMSLCSKETAEPDVPSDFLSRAGQDLLVDVYDDDLVAVLDQALRDTGAHNTSAYDSDCRHCSIPQFGREQGRPRS